MSKKIKCFLCGKDEKIVDDKVIRRFCTNCLMNGNYTKYKFDQAKEERLQELRK